VCIDASAKAAGDSGEGARPTRRAGREDDGAFGGAAKRFGGRSVGGVARLSEGFAFDGKEARGTASADLVRGGFRLCTDEAGSQTSAERERRRERLEGSCGKGSIGLRVRKQ
jgi:hypothetical protein